MNKKNEDAVYAEESDTGKTFELKDQEYEYDDLFEHHWEEDDEIHD